MKIIAFLHYLVAILNPSIATDSVGHVSASSPAKEVRIERTVINNQGDTLTQDIMGGDIQRTVQVTTGDTDWVAVLIPLAAFLMLGLIAWKDLDTKKQVRLAMIEKGLDPTSLEAAKDATRRYGALRFGMLLVGISAGLLAGFGVCNMFGVPESYYELVVIATTVFFAGLSLIGYHMIATSLNKHR